MPSLFFAEQQLNSEHIDPEWVAASPLRSLLYGWFSTLFARELGRDAMALYQGGGAADIMAVLAELGMGREADAVAGVFQEWARHADAAVENAADFATLFLMEGRACPLPYASHYLDGGGQLYGKPALLMRAMLASNRLRLDEPFKEPEDHLAVMLALMSHWARACDRPADLAGQAREQAAFIESALLSWIDAWLARMHAIKTLTFRFYPAVGALLAAFLRADRDYLRSFGVGQ